MYKNSPVPKLDKSNKKTKFLVSSSSKSIQVVPKKHLASSHKSKSQEKRRPSRIADCSINDSQASDSLPVLLKLLQGAFFYKRFRQNMQMNQNVFDPLKGDKLPPEQCGYGIRFVQMDTSLQFLNIRNNLRNAIEFQIPVADIIKVILPKSTLEIIKAYKAQENTNLDESCFSGKKSSKRSDNSMTRHNQPSAGLHFSQKATCYFPFSIALQVIRKPQPSSGKDGSGRVDLIATSYDTLKEWIQGINLLIKRQENKKA